MYNTLSYFDIFTMHEVITSTEIINKMTTSTIMVDVATKANELLIIV